MKSCRTEANCNIGGQKIEIVQYIFVFHAIRIELGAEQFKQVRKDIGE